MKKQGLQAQVVEEVSFDEPLTGAQIVALVREVAGDAFISLQFYQDGHAYIVGQRGEPSDHLVVVPSLDDLVFKEYVEYSVIRVATYYWKSYFDRAKEVPEGYGYEAEKAAVQRFAAELNRLVGKPKK